MLSLTLMGHTLFFYTVKHASQKDQKLVFKTNYRLMQFEEKLQSALYSKTCFSNRPKIGFQDQLSLSAGQKYCRMLQREHSAILSTSIKLPFIFKTFVLSISSCCFTQVILYNRLLSVRYPIDTQFVGLMLSL